MPPGSTSVAIRCLFNPEPANGNIQTRLQLYVMAYTRSSDTREILRLLIERGALNRFYRYERIQQFKAPIRKLKSACKIIRKEDIIEPLHSAEFNDKIPSFYYAIRSFTANFRNDFIALDRVLGNVQESVIVDVCIEPFDVSKELSAHTRYLSQLQSINRSWDFDSEDNLEPFDYIGDDPKWQTPRKESLRPLRYQDPLADDILRSQQRLIFSVPSNGFTKLFSTLTFSLISKSWPRPKQLLSSLVRS